MDILVISIASDDDTYKRICSERKSNKVEPAHSFFKHVIEGLSVDTCNNIEAISILPVSHSNHSQIVWDYSRIDIKSNLQFTYLPFQNRTISRFYTQNRSVKRYVKSWIMQRSGNKELAVIVDPILWHVTGSVRKYCNKRKITCVPIVTDLPIAWLSMNKKTGIRKIPTILYNVASEIDLKRYSSYIFLTKYMNESINTEKKPYIIIEGLIDIPSDLDDVMVTKEKSVVYAGGIYKVFGLDAFAKAYSKHGKKDYTLCFYGSGDCVEEIIAIEKTCSNVKYMGIVSPDEIRRIESRATLLVNPRQTGRDYTKYSFPSKILEYMSTGTPVITTHLPGIPSEYDDYLYFFSGNDPIAYVEKIKQVLNSGCQTLNEFGFKAKKFVATSKQSSAQAMKIVNFIKQYSVARK